MYYITSNELYHHGVKGMKWGVRRYQNKDGSLTPAGKKHQASQERKDQRKQVRSDIKALRNKKSVVNYNHEGVVTGARLHDGRKLGAKYTAKLLNTDLRNRTVATIAGGVAAGVGAAFVMKATGFITG